MAITAAEAFRDYETDGVPSSGSHKIKKSDMRSWGAWIEAFINAIGANSGLVFTLRASLDLVLNHPAATMAWVIGDPVAANNGIYQKLGASGTGSWLRVSDLPFSFIIASDAGAGTANAIQATTPIPVSESALIILNVFEANTASPVTVSFNGGSALTIKTNTGSDVAAGGLVSGMRLLGVISGSTFRLVSDQVSSAIVAAAEDAADRAEAAASAINYVTSYGSVDLTGAVSAQAVIEAAVAWSYANNTPLFWPDGVYLSTASIPNFHDVRHQGPGVVKRGTDLWYITPPSYSEINHVYAAASGGLSTNDGLSASQPFDTFQNAIEAIEKWAPLERGQWQIDLAAGVYARGRFPDEGLMTAFPIRIVGPSVGGHPNVPTAIIREGATEAAFGILAFYTDIYVQDVKIEDYNGSSSSSGIRVNWGRVLTNNVHFEDCYYGVTGMNFATIDVKGGIFNDCGYLNSDSGQASGHAIRGVFHTKWEIGTQSAGTLANGPIIRNSAGAARAQEYADGHWDYVTIEDCSSGLRLLVNSRLNIDGSSFKRISNSAVYATQGSYVDPTSSTVFGTGADANGRNYSMGSGSNASGGGIIGQNVANSANPGILKTSFPNQVINSTANAAIDTFTVDQDALNDAQFSGISAKKLIARVSGDLTGTTGTFKRLLLRVGGTLAGGTPTTISFSQTATGPFEATFEVAFTGPNAQYVSMGGRHSSSSPVNNANTTIATNADVVVSLEGVMNNAADSITIKSVEWSQIGF
ncbi:hypothetical protein KNLIENLN_00072 [Sinorhizobium phage NV1.1.1]|nr:hypothetical protein KNLIENLN_00072 [Sinorhizobium phage NV1.1.1]